MKAPNEPRSTFASLGVIEPLQRILEDAGYTQPYPIQEKTIPVVLRGKDVLGIARTGSGKTASYVLPVLQLLHERQWESPNRHISVLVLVPTRELAQQVHDVVEQFADPLPQPVRSMVVFGGVSINPQMIGMQGVQLLIATPGRLLDLIGSKALHLSSLKMLVLDEADKLLNKNFKGEIDGLLALMPKKRQNLLFSATLNKDVDQMTQLILHKPELIQIAANDQQTELIQQRAFRVAENRKGPFLRYLIKNMDLDQVLVFTSSIYSAEHVAEKLRKNGIEADCIHGKKSNHARKEVLADLKSGELRVLVATDLLSRGIDIAFLPYVINYELPRSPKDFIHRIGRTGRAENPGEAFTLVTPEEQHHFKVIQKKMKRWLTLEGTDAVDLHGY